MGKLNRSIALFSILFYLLPLSLVPMSFVSSNLGVYTALRVHTPKLFSIS